MKCARSGCNEPARHMREFLQDGKVIVEHLCDLHQEEAEMLDMMQRLVNDDIYDAIRAEIQCRSICSCGMTLARFREEQIAGCAECYDRFSEVAEQIITQVHGVDRYAGPHRIDSRKYRIAALREQIRRAVEREEFREAARLHQELLALEQQDDEEV